MRCFAEESVEVGAVDVDFATYLREGDEALVAVILPRLGEMPRSLRAVSDSIHSLLESSALRRVMRSMICSSVAWRLRHFFFRHYEQQCRWGDILRCTLHSGVRVLDSIYKKIESG